MGAIDRMMFIRQEIEAVLTKPTRSLSIHIVYMRLSCDIVGALSHRKEDRTSRVELDRDQQRKANLEAIEVVKAFGL